MGNIGKKLVTKAVEKAKDVLMAEAEPPKPVKKGKRVAGIDVNKDKVPSKKQKVERKKNEAKPKKVVKKVVDTSEDVTFQSDTKTKAVPAKKVAPAVSSKNGRKCHGKKGTSSDEINPENIAAKTKKTPAKAVKRASGADPMKKDDSSDELDFDEESNAVVVDPQKKNLPTAETKQSSEALVKRADKSENDEDSSYDGDGKGTLTRSSQPKVSSSAADPKELRDVSDTEDDTSSDDNATVTESSAPPTVAKNGATEESDSSSDEDSLPAKSDQRKNITNAKDDSYKVSMPSSSEDRDEEPQKKVKSEAAVRSSSQTVDEDSSSGEEEYAREKNEVASKKSSPAEESSEDEDEDDSLEEEETNYPSQENNADVEMTDAVSTEANLVEEYSAEKKPKTLFTGKSEGLKRVFVGNLSYSVEQTDIENFFKVAGEIIDINFSMYPDGSFKGHAHVEFDSPDSAEKAVRQLNGKDLLGRRVKIKLARERRSYTPQSGGRETSFQLGFRSSGKTVFVRGFNKNGTQDEIRSSLEEFFGGCGDITRISVPKDQEGAVKGYAYIDIKGGDSFSQALKLNGSEFGDGTLTVEEARPRVDSRDGGGRDGWRNINWNNQDPGSRFCGPHGCGHDGGQFAHGVGGGRGDGLRNSNWNNQDPGSRFGIPHGRDHDGGRFTHGDCGGRGDGWRNSNWNNQDPGSTFCIPRGRFTHGDGGGRGYGWRNINWNNQDPSGRFGIPHGHGHDGGRFTHGVNRGRGPGWGSFNKPNFSPSGT